MLKTVESYNDALLNAKSFNEELKCSDFLQNKLSQFKHWYYFEETNTFAPSKYIGYYDNSAETYENYLYMGLDGRETERALRKLFIIAKDTKSEELYKQLENDLSMYDKRPKKNAVIHLKK